MPRVWPWRRMLQVAPLTGSDDWNSMSADRLCLALRKSTWFSCRGSTRSTQDLWLISMREMGLICVRSTSKSEGLCFWIRVQEQDRLIYWIPQYNMALSHIKKLDSMPDGGRLPNVVVPIPRGWHIGVQISEIFCFVNRFRVFCVFMSHFYCRYENGWKPCCVKVFSHKTTPPNPSVSYKLFRLGGGVHRIHGNNIFPSPPFFFNKRNSLWIFPSRIRK